MAVQDGGEFVERHIRLRHGAAGAIEAIEIAAGGEFDLQVHGHLASRDVCGQAWILPHGWGRLLGQLANNTEEPH